MAKEPHTFTLSGPLKTHDGDVRELKLKEPKAKLFVKYDDPFKLLPSKSGEDFLEFFFNNVSMLHFLADMTGIDELILEELPTSDYYHLRQAAANIILGAVPDKNPSSQPVA